MLSCVGLSCPWIPGVFSSFVEATLTMRPPSLAIVIVGSTLVVLITMGCGTAGARAGDVLEVTRDTVLDPGKSYGAIVIRASGVTIDGRGAWLLGPAAGRSAPRPADFQGVAIQARGVSNVRLRNLNVRGWETALTIEDGAQWLVEGCNFSDNFHDPDFGWGENGRRGGMVLTRLRSSIVRDCRANRVWDACVLVGCTDNTIEDNSFSHASNTALKLWTSSGNRVRRNNLSHGLRIRPGEVHARDSSCVLIESGSNDNRFEANNCTHGGDGIFIRVLNGWVSTGNVFEGNDCSYANNNGFEAWSPRNTYRRNTANHCSYGFWLGASDQTILEANEASYNGDPRGFHNSPHLPGGGHAGIVFMFGPSSHTIVRGNICVDNNGAGIAAIGDQASRGKNWTAHHWIIEENILDRNRWGLYLQHADWIELAANRFTGNRDADVKEAGDVREMTVHSRQPGVERAPRAVLDGPTRAETGRAVVFDAGRSRDPRAHPLEYRWYLGDGRTADGPRVETTYRSPGFYRLGVTVTNGTFSDLAWRDLYVVQPVAEIGTEGVGAAGRWGWIDPRSRVTFSSDRGSRIVGEDSLCAVVDPYGGERVSLRFPAIGGLNLDLKGKSRLVFWIKVVNENIPAWQGPNPVVTFYESSSRAVRLEPRRDLLASPPFNEAREGWTYIAVPLRGDALWKRDGAEIATVDSLAIGFDSWGTPPLRIWIDGLAVQ
jgi:parallel beta-helix repeat protein